MNSLRRAGSVSPGNTFLESLADTFQKLDRNVIEVGDEAGSEEFVLLCR
jgi:hypothetical protein